MKLSLFPAWLVFSLAVLISFNPVYSANSLGDSYGMQAPVSLKTLNSKIKYVEGNTELDEENKTRLLRIYQKTIWNLENIQANNVATSAFIHSKKTDPEQMARIRKELQKRMSKASAEISNSVRSQKNFAEMEQYLFSENANLAAVKAKLSGLEQQLTLARAKPNAVRQQLIKARHDQVKMTNKLLAPAPEDELPVLSEATQWMLQSRQVSLRIQIRMLDQELLSLPMRIDLFEADREKNAFIVEQLNKRVAAAQAIVNQQRQLEAKKAKTMAKQVQQELKGKHELIQKLVDQNAILSDDFSQLTNESERVTRDNKKTKQDNDRITHQFLSIRKKLDLGGYSRVMGQVLIEQQRQLPKPSMLRIKSTQRADKIAEIGLQKYQYSEEYKQLNKLSDYVDQLTVNQPEKVVKEVQEDLEKLAISRQKLLKRLIELDDSYLRSLNDIEHNKQALLSTINDYQGFIDKSLLWLRSGALPNFSALLEMPSRLAWLISPTLWHEVSTALINQATDSPFLLLGVITVLVLLWKTKSMRAALRETGVNIGKISQDNIRFTFYAFGLSLLLAASWPLLLGLLGWQLSVSLQPTAFTGALSHSLLLIALYFFGLRMFRVFCESGGLYIAHFQVAESIVLVLHRELGRLMLIILPAFFIFIVMARFDLTLAVGEAGRLFLAIALIAFAVFFYRITVTQKSLLVNDHSRWQYLWRLVIVATPLILVVFNLIGYIYTVSFLTTKLINTLWLVSLLIVIKRVAVRWLLLTQRRLKWEAMLESQAAEQAKKEVEPSEHTMIEAEYGELEDAEIDFAVLSQESLKLLQATFILLVMIGLFLIWKEILPAFSLLNDITLWSYNGVVAGEQQLIPLTLLDLGIAGLILFVTLAATNYLPSLLEIIMLQTSKLNAGSRYTITTMTSYSILAIGFILFFNTIGVDWSKIQWLVAALGVGIGFGLQEIVANFISGIIILFERPIRVGDIVTVGDNEGKVEKIRIRATTIRNWDRKELLVPNKEFITGQLINWTLSEATTRIVIPVGLAYGGDVELALTIMIEAAKEESNVLTDPEPSVVFDEFGDNALSLKLRCFVPETSYRMPTTTALHKAINQKFNDAGLVIAFPQRDIHLNTNAPLDIRIQREAKS